MNLVANNLKADLKCEFSYKYGITVTGNADINIKKLNMDLAIGFSTQPGVPATELAPKLEVSNVNVAINPDDIDIKLSGSLVSKIASVFIPLFKKTLIPMIVDDLEAQVKDLVDKTIDMELAKDGTQAVIPYLAGVTFDFAQMAGGPQISTDGVFSMVVNGTFFDGEDVKPSAYTPAAWSPRDPKGKQFQGYLTDYTLNTAFESGFQTGNTLDITELLGKLNVTITTDQLAQIVPEFATKYGAGKAVAISGMFPKAACVSKFTSAGQTLNGNLLVTIKVEDEVALVAEFNDFAAQAKLYSKDGSVFGNIGEYSVGTLNADSFQTSLGLTADQVLTDVQTLVNTDIGSINDELAAGIAVPSIKGIDLSDFELDFFEGYLEFGMSVSTSFWDFALGSLPFNAQAEQDEIIIFQ